MAIVIDDKILKGGTVSEKELLIDIAFFLYDKGLIGLGKAREFCGLNVNDFQREMAKREISYYTEESMLKEIEGMKTRHEI